MTGSGEVVRIDPASGRPGAALRLGGASGALFSQFAVGPSGVWATDYDAGVPYRGRH